MSEEWQRVICSDETRDVLADESLCVGGEIQSPFHTKVAAPFCVVGIHAPHFVLRDPINFGVFTHTIIQWPSYKSHFIK